MSYYLSTKLAHRYLDHQRFASLKCDVVSGGGRKKYADAVWDMYKATYARIGLHIKSAMEMIAKYDRWEVCLVGGKPVQFSLYKTTPYGFKAGLAGHDGSSEGKRKAVSNLLVNLKKSGYYGEVSHKVEDIALAAGSPVVCSLDAEGVLRKKLEHLPDGVHYSRTLGGLGKVTKIMVGRPKGVSTTTAQNPSCPVELQRKASEECEDDDCDFDSHYACLAYEEFL